MQELPEHVESLLRGETMFFGDLIYAVSIRIDECDLLVPVRIRI